MSKEDNNGSVVNYEERMLGKNLHFAAAEAYKLLRTNLNFSIREEEKSRVVGITSAERGEGKSTTSINLAYTIAETGKKVLLIECDMRLPNIGMRLSLKKSMGLSNLLAGQEKPSDVLQHSGMQPSLFVITAGSVPPNPSELLSSEKMHNYIEAFRNSFEFIILDLPPVNIVSDALVVSNLVDGFVFVVREEFATKRSFREAMSRFNVSTNKILGIVMTDVSGKEGGYAKRYKKRYYRKSGYYGHRYGYGYGYGYGYDYGYGYGYGSKPGADADSAESKKEKKTEKPVKEKKDKKEKKVKKSAKKAEETTETKE